MIGFWWHMLAGVVGAGFVMGCASGPEEMQERWVSAHGGVIGDARQERVERVSGALVAQCAGGAIRVRVLDSEVVTAFGWRNGEVFVTRGLVDCMEDEELAAAVAHELGHLLGELRK